MNSKALIIGAIIFTILLAGIVAGALLVQQQQELREKAAPATTISFLPGTKTAEVGETVKLSVNIDTSKNLVKQADLSLTFDAQKVELTEITPGPFLPNIITPAQISNSLGTASVSYAAQTTNPAQGKGVLATLVFKAIDSGSAKISLTSQTKVTGFDQGKNANLLASQPSPATLTILSSTGFPSTGGVTSPSPSPSPTASPQPSPSPSSSPLASPNPATAGEGASPTPSPSPLGGSGGSELPEAGISLPSIAIISTGALVLFIGLLLAF